MTAFHTIAIPHDDILQGKLTMDVFAADLWEVFKGRGVDEYKKPELFFQKAYETEGLKTLLDVVEKRLKGKGGDPVLQIQTPFGGGMGRKACRHGRHEHVSQRYFMGHVGRANYRQEKELQRLGFPRAHGRITRHACERRSSNDFDG